MDAPAEELVVTCPRRLRIVGYIFFFVGIVSVLEIVWAFVRGAVRIDFFGIICLPAGYCMARGKTNWRGFMFVVSGLMVLAALAGAGVLIYEGATGGFRPPYPAFPLSLAVARAISASGLVVALGLVFGWILRVLMTREAYDSAHPLRTRVVKVERSTYKAFILTALLAVVFSVASHAVLKTLSRWEGGYDAGLSIVGRENGAIDGYSYGRRFGQLVYVVFQEESSGSISQVVSVKGHADEDKVILRTPDDKEIRLPNETQLYEIVDGKFRSSPERVTLGQLEAFIASSPRHYTIDALLEFVK